jgi:hypothetical protein
VLSILEIGRITTEKAMENSIGQMDPYMKENGKRI